MNQGRVWGLEFLEARTEQGVGRESNKRPREHKKSQPKIWTPEYQPRLKSGLWKKKVGLGSQVSSHNDMKRSTNPFHKNQAKNWTKLPTNNHFIEL